MTSTERGYGDLESKIFLIRGTKVMLAHDLADLYEVSTKRLNEQVQRNMKRFPSDFMFALSEHEISQLKVQQSTPGSQEIKRRYAPLAFTEQGIAMLSAVLHSDRAIEVNIEIMRSFVRLRNTLGSNESLEKRLLDLETKYDGKFQTVFAAIRELMSNHAVPRKRIIPIDTKGP